MKLFELFATLSLDTTDFDADVKAAKKDGEDLNSVLSTAVAKGTVVGNTLMAAGRGLVTFGRSVLGFGVDIVETAAEVQAEQHAFESTFGEMQGIALAAFDRVGEATNIYTKRLMVSGTKAYSQFRAAGMDSAVALNQMETYLMYAADAAAYYNISLEEADYAMRSFLRGNVEGGEAIGLFITQTQRETKAMEMYDAAWKELDESQRQSVLMSIIGETYARNGVFGQATREMYEYENVLGNIREMWRQIKAILGGPILEALMPVMQEFAQFLEDNPEIVQSLAQSIGAIAGLVFDGLMTLLKYLAEHGDEIASYCERFASAIKMLSEGNFRGVVDLFMGENNWLSGLLFGGQGKPVEEWNDANEGGNNVMTYEDLYGHEASGLGYVPYDNFRARLHRGETVVAAAEVNRMRNGKRAGYSTGDMAAAIASALNGTAVQMDGHAVGVLVTGTVSKEIAREAKRRR